VCYFCVCRYVGDGQCDRDRHDIIIRGSHMIHEGGHMTYDGSSHDVSGWLCHIMAHTTWPNDELTSHVFAHRKTR